MAGLPTIVMVTSEIAPYSKTGGLGDVCGALAIALAEAGHRVVTISPRYAGPRFEAAEDTGLRFDVPLAGATHTAAILRLTVGGVEHLFVAHPMYERDGIYGDQSGSFGDNHLRYALLCRAALDATRRLLGEDVVFHCNDWQTGLLPVYLEALYRPLGLYTRTPSILALHNPAHQGRLPASLFWDLELAARWFGVPGVEFHGDLCLLKGGIVQADQLTTVSPTFAWEVTTSGGGFGLEGVLRHRAADLTGILNGIDTTAWDPASDPFIEAPYRVGDLAGKAACKAALQRELGLPVDPRVPLVGSVGRLDPQKGVELILDSVPWLVDQGCQVVLLGSAAAAHARYEHHARALEHAHPTAVRAWVGFDEALSHRIEAGADLFLMPSLFEPCGLNQMYSLRYGTPPVVRRTGGLADTVQQCDPAAGKGTGYLFDRPIGPVFREAIWHALQLYRNDEPGWAALVERGMSQDFSWAQAVAKYQAVYRAAINRRA